jgi:cation diffusion facilitator CzcD-associated flavoprotein CzcO
VNKHIRVVEVVVVGAGFAGIGAAIKLRAAGYRDFVILERSGEVGGTWRDNSYPGCACDVPSHLYSYSFAPYPEWSRRFAPQAEIDAYLRRCTDDFGLRPHLLTGCELVGARWHEDIQRWVLATSTGPITARVLVMATGPLSEPAMPRIAGLASFAGPVFHSARWDHDHDTAGERVAVIGTGASAIQFVPHLQRTARHVTVFQRTPPWVAPRGDVEVSPARRAAYRHWPFLQRMARAREFWAREAMLPALLGNEWLRKAGQRSVLAHLERQVRDPALRATLTPDYAMGCNRILLSDDYLPALTEPNVSVVPGGAIEIRPDGIVGADGTEHPADTLVLGTGFSLIDAPVLAHLIGRDGRSLATTWDRSPQAYLGTTVAGFPNLFLLAGPNTGIAHTSLIYMIEAQLDYVVRALRTLAQLEMTSMEVRPQVQRAYNDDLQQRMRRTVWSSGGCHSWYLDHTGRNTALWPRATWRFRRATRRVRVADYTFGSLPESPNQPPTTSQPAASVGPPGQEQ